jgi:hypothetical protein
MNPEIRARWTAALRSGDYPQGEGHLRDGKDKFCCLGVLCDLAVKDGVAEAIHTRPGCNWAYGDETAYLPETVRRWAQLDSSNPDTPEGSLDSLNDGGRSFAYIADVIDGGVS